MMTTYIEFRPDKYFIVFTKDQDLRKKADLKGLQEVLHPAIGLNLEKTAD